MLLTRKFTVALACSFLLFSSAEALQGKSQGKGHDKDKTKARGNAKKEFKTTGPTFAHSTPHKLKVPPGHYPPAGMCRLWYPGRPPGQQPKSVPCNQLIGVPLTDGAFILHGDRAYDTQYDWRKEEVKKPKSVPRQIIDILFPGNKFPDKLPKTLPE